MSHVIVVSLSISLVYCEPSVRFLLQTQGMGSIIHKGRSVIVNLPLLFLLQTQDRSQRMISIIHKGRRSEELLLHKEVRTVPREIINTTKTRKRLCNARLKLSSFFHHFIFFLEKWLALSQNTFFYYQKLVENRKRVRIPLTIFFTERSPQ